MLRIAHLTNTPVATVVFLRGGSAMGTETARMGGMRKTVHQQLYHHAMGSGVPIPENVFLILGFVMAIMTVEMEVTSGTAHAMGFPVPMDAVFLTLGGVMAIMTVEMEVTSGTAHQQL